MTKAEHDRLIDEHHQRTARAMRERKQREDDAEQARIKARQQRNALPDWIAHQAVQAKAREQELRQRATETQEFLAALEECGSH